MSSETKTVRLVVTFDIEQEVPAEWDNEQILFYFNDSSHCANNLLHAAVGRYCVDEDCACSHTTVGLAP